MLSSYLLFVCLLILFAVKEYNKIFPISQTVRLGDPLYITCISNYTVSWVYYNFEDIIYTINKVYVELIQIDQYILYQLQFPKISYSNEGFYRCIGINEFNLKFYEIAVVKVVGM